MLTKAFEIRDIHTFVAVMATKMSSDHPNESYLCRHSGFSKFSDMVVLCRMDCSTTSRSATWDPQAWADRTMQTAHEYIQQHWDKLESGEVIDVEWILGETKKKKLSQLFDYPDIEIM